MKVFFETERVLVRRLEPEDAERLYENHAEEKVKKWFPNESYADLNEAKDAVQFLEIVLTMIICLLSLRFN